MAVLLELVEELEVKQGVQGGGKVAMRDLPRSHRGAMQLGNEDWSN